MSGTKKKITDGKIAGGRVDFRALPGTVSVPPTPNPSTAAVVRTSRKIFIPDCWYPKRVFSCLDLMGPTDRVSGGPVPHAHGMTFAGNCVAGSCTLVVVPPQFDSSTLW